MSRKRIKAYTKLIDKDGYKYMFCRIDKSTKNYILTNPRGRMCKMSKEEFKDHKFKTIK